MVCRCAVTSYRQLLAIFVASLFLIFGFGIEPALCASVSIGTAALISPSSADSFYGSSTTSSDGLSGITGTETPTPPEIVELARALKNDPDLIYQYVRNNIQISWMYGLQKGALGAEIAKSGTAFDQAELMVALLRQSGFTASYVGGTIVLNQTQFYNWSGITNARAACQLLSSGGIPASVNGTNNAVCSSISSGDSVSTIQMAHIWVQVTIPGSHSAGCSSADVCVFDPAYKVYVWKAGINLASAMGLTSGVPLSDTMSGSTSGSDSSGGASANYIKTLNATNLDSDLQTYSANLLNYIQSNNLQGAQMEDIVSGGVLAPDNTTVRQSALSYADPSPPYSPHVWTPSATDTARFNAIPNQYRSTLEVHPYVEVYNTSCVAVDTSMFDATFYEDEIDSRRLSLDTDFQLGFGGAWTSNTMTLVLDDQNLSGLSFTNSPPSCFGYATTRGLPAHITFTASHPYAASSDGTPTTAGNYMDQTLDKQVVLVTSLSIVNGWGGTSAALFGKWSDERNYSTPVPATHAPQCPDTPGEYCPDFYGSNTGDFDREKTNADWLAQYTREARLNAAISQTVPQFHHVIGVVYGDTTLDPYYWDPHQPPQFKLSDNFNRLDLTAGLSLTSKTSDATARRATIQSIAATASTLEGSISQQVADVPDGASVASRFEWGNSPPSDHSAFGQNPVALGPQKFYQFTSANSVAATGLVQVDGLTSTTSSGETSGLANPPVIGSFELNDWRAALFGPVQSYTAQNYSVVTAQEAFLGPGQRAGAWNPTTATHTYDHRPAKQRGGALVAIIYDANGEPIGIDHVTTGLSASTDGGTIYSRGGGGGVTPDTPTRYDPADAADILKSKFVDRSKALGIDLSNGSLSYDSPASLRVGNGGFPYELQASLSWHAQATGGAFQVPTQPRYGWTTNWNNNLALSGSGMEAMGASDIRASVGSIAAFAAMQDIYRGTATPVGSNQVVAGNLASAWWSDQIVGNVATVMHGWNSGQFVRLPSGQWIKPGAGYASLSQTGSRAAYELKCLNPPSQSQPYELDRTWNLSGVSFAQTNAQNDVESFSNWLEHYVTSSYAECGAIKGFRLNSWTFPQGATVSLTYGAAYDPRHNTSPEILQLTQVSNNVGRTLSFSNTNGVLNSISNGLTGTSARTLTINNGTLGSTIWPMPPSFTDPASATTSFTYLSDFVTSPTQRPVPYQLMSEVFTAENTTQANTHYDYDSEGRVKDVLDAVAIQQGTRGPYNFYVADGTRGERDDPLGQPYTVVYDIYGHPSRYIDELGIETDALFDSRTRLLQTIYPEGDCEAFAYDDRNNTTDYWHVDTSSGCNTGAGSSHVLHASATWDPTWNKPLTVTNARGYTTTLTYYPSGSGASLLHTATRPSITEGTPVYSFTYDAKGKILTSVVPFTSSQTITTSNTYDPTYENLLSTTLDPGTGHVASATSLTYDAQGDPITTTDPRSNVTSTSYDNDRRKTEDDHHNGSGTAALISAERIIYDILGRDKENDSGTVFSGTTVTTWLPMKTTTYTPVSKVATVTDADNRATTNAYDNDDRLLTVTDPVSRATHFVYCAPGDTNCAANQVKIELRAWAGSSNACSVSGTLQECYRQVAYFPDGEQQSLTDANGNVTTYAYDPFVRLTTTTFPDSSYELLSLDANGNMLTRRNRAGQTLTYTYNTLDWPLTKVSPSPSLTTSWYYQLNGAIDYLSDTAGNIVDYGYDTAGRKTSEANTIAGLSGAKTASYVLDASGNRTKLTFPDGYYTGYCYDALDRMVSAMENTTSCTTSLLATYTYDPLSRRTNLAYGNGASMAYTYANTPDLLTLNHDLSGTANDAHYTFTYTNAHQLASEANTLSAYLWQPPATSSTSYVPNNLNQYASVGGVSYAYDANGNLTSDGTTTYGYDAENRLLSASNTSISAAYAYDPLGRRMHKSGTGVTETFFADDGTDELAEYNSAGSLVTRYVPGPAIDEPIAMVPVSGSKTYFHTNKQGSVIAMSGTSAALAEGPYTYDPYGNCFSGSSPCSTGEPYRFTGQRFDAETGLLYYRARYYSPFLGRFMQTDPVGYTADLNLYAYGANDPTNETDPDGDDAVNCNITDNNFTGCSVTRDSNSNTVVTYNFTTHWTDANGDEHTEHSSSKPQTLEGRITDQPTLLGKLTGSDPQTNIISTIAQALSVYTGHDVSLAADSSSDSNAGSSVARVAASSGGRVPMRPGQAPNTQENANARDATRQAERSTGQKMTREQQREFHDRITGQNMTYHEMVEEAESILRGQ